MAESLKNGSLKTILQLMGKSSKINKSFALTTAMNC